MDVNANIPPPPPPAHKKYESVAAINFPQAIECGQLVSSSLLDRVLVNFSPELPKFAEMLLENDVAFITP